MKTSLTIRLEDAVVVRVKKIGWRAVWLEITIAERTFTRKYRKNDVQCCAMSLKNESIS